MNQIDLNAVNRSVEYQPNEIGEMSNEALDAARRSVEMLEGDPIRFNTLAKVMQQPALASQRSCVSVRPNLFRSARSPRSFLYSGASAYRVAPPRFRGPDFEVRGVANSSRAFLEAECTRRRGIVCRNRCSSVAMCVD